MKIQSKFDELKFKIHKSMFDEKESLSLLELKLFSSDELKQTGFICENVYSMLCECKPELDEIDEYFYENCYDIPVNKLNLKGLSGEQIGVAEYIFHVKCVSMEYDLNKKLYEFIKSYKKME